MTHIRLGMIVRDAEQKLPTLAAAVKPLVQSWYIIDTGSTDRTRETVLELFADLPGHLDSADWVGHAHNRTLLLKQAKWAEAEPIGLPPADYLLMVDDDMEVVVTAPLPPLILDEYMIPIHDRGLIYPLPLMTSMRREWKYEGVAHAYLCATDGIEVKTETLDCLHFVEHNAGPREGKIEQDRDNLLQATKDDPRTARNWFYLGQSHRDLGQYVEAIACYRMAASLSRWEEEKYYALYQAGQLLVSEVSFYEGAPVLLEAWRMRPHRAEALRTLAGASSGVADKIPLPTQDVLFVEKGAYKQETREVQMEFGNVMAVDREPPRFLPDGSLDPACVSAIIPTRGDHPREVQMIVDSLPYGQIVVWDNSKAKIDLKVFGRYAAIPLTTNPVIYWQDDDVMFEDHEALLRAYEPGRLVANMDQAWIDGARYGDRVALPGLGSLCDADLPGKVWTDYFASFPFDEDVLTCCDFIFGSIVDFTRVDLGCKVFPYTDDPDRLYHQPGQTERKWSMIDRGRKLKFGPDWTETPTGQSDLWVPRTVRMA